MNTEVVKITVNEPVVTSRQRVTLADIARVKEDFIKKNLLLSFEEAGAVLGKSARTIKDLVNDGKLILADENAIKPGRKGAACTAGSRVTAESVEKYRLSILVPAEKWGE